MNFLNTIYKIALENRLKVILILFISFFISCNSNSIFNTRTAFSEQELNNLISFAEIYGDVKYFHPSTECSEIDWSNFAIIGIREVLKASNDNELKEKLEELFLPIAPSIQINLRSEEKPFELSEITPENTEGFKIVYWKHIGLNVKNEPFYSPYKSYIVNKDSVGTDTSLIKMGDYAENTLSKNISFKMPIALYYKDNNTYPKSSEKQFISLKRKTGIDFDEKFSINDKAYILANVVITWNIFRHFYPYFDDIDSISSGNKNKQQYWESKLKQALNAASLCNTEMDFEKILKLLVAGLQDGHGEVRNQNYNICYPPFITAWIEEKLVITKILDTNITSIKRGDIITKIENKDALELIKEEEKYISSATSEYKRIKCIEQELFKGEPLSKLNIFIDGNINPIEFTRTIGFYDYFEKASRLRGHKDLEEIIHNVYYVNLLNISEKELQENLNKLRTAKGIIFEMRGYPKHSITFILQHLTEDTLLSGRFLLPVITKPDYSNVIYDTAGRRWRLPPLTPRIKGKVIFLIDAHAVSYSESIMAIVEYYKLGEIFGEHTAGTNGNTNSSYLPGNYLISWTGMKVLKHDGSKLQGVGIVPTTRVIQTISGIKRGEDEVLQKAAEEIIKK